MITRRDFVKSGLVAGFGGIVIPPILAKGVAAATSDGIHNSRVLVVVQLGGGNDGLNTIVPLADAAYRGLRPTVAIPPSAALPLNARFGFHPSLTNTRSLFAAGKVAVVQGVGYPNPNYSHFQSMAVWANADPTGAANGEGWLGKLLETQISSVRQPLCACAIGEDSTPLEMLGAQYPPVTSITADGTFSYWGGSAAEQTAAALYAGTPGPWGVLLDSNLSNLNGSADALAASAYTPSGSYIAPGATAPTDLALAFRTSAKVIATQPATKIIHLSMGSFDSHQGQLTDQAALLLDLDFSVNAFLADLAAHNQDSRVAVMTWSEFGRRAAENGSGGTDHGSANSLLIYGTPVAGGLFGAPCSLTDLDDGNLKYTTDFRSVYQDVISGWLGGDAAAVLGGPFPALGLFH